MRNLTINNLQFVVETANGEFYGALIPFKPGLNIIYGPNSVGKSSIITGIIYGLGGEKALGIFQNDQNPFKPEFYDRIHDQKVKQAFLLLEISNGNKIITIYRRLFGQTNICAVKECTLSKFHDTKKHSTFVVSGEGVFDEGGFQRYLFHFLNWRTVEVPKYDGGSSKLYLENLLPLFFVEQRAGWSQVQARQITRYGIREIKKVAFEYIMGLDRFFIHLEELERKELLDKLNRLKKELEEKEQNIMVLCNGNIQDNELYVTRNRHEKREINEMIRVLKNELLEKEKTIKDLTPAKERSSTFAEEKREQLRKTAHLKRRSSEKISQLINEVAGYTNYIERIEINKGKNQQLKKITNLKLEFDIHACPVCQQKIDQDQEDGSCKLCHQDIKRISNPDENLSFLEDEKKSFEKVKEAKQLELRKEQTTFSRLTDREATLIEDLDQRFKTYFGKDIDALRQRILELDLIQKDIELYIRILARWKALNELRQEILKVAQDELALKKKLEKARETSSDFKILTEILKNFKANIKALHLFKSREALIDQIKLDGEDNYAPYLQAYDLYNISSSSDNIRIMLSYYLALTQTSLNLHNLKEIRFPNLLLLDEPKQQNLDDRDLKEFIDLTNKLSPDKSQVILTTFSSAKRDKSFFEEFIIYEMKNENDYLLKKINRMGNQ